MTLHPASNLDDHRSAPVLAIAIPVRLVGALVALACLLGLVALASWSVDDPSFSYATDKPVENWLGFAGSAFADMGFQLLGLGGPLLLLPPLFWSWSMIRRIVPSYLGLRFGGWLSGTLLATGMFACIPTPETWPLPLGLGGFVGSGFSALYGFVLGQAPQGWGAIAFGLVLGAPALGLILLSARTRPPFEMDRPAPSKSKKRQHAPEPEAESDIDSAGIFAIGMGF